MSPRKGGPRISDTKTIRIPAHTHAKLLKYAQSFPQTSMGDIVEEFTEKGVKWNIYRADWFEQRMKADAIINKYANLDEACPALAGAKKSSGDFLYRCVWYRPDAPPSIKNLGDSEELQGAACISCGGTKPFVVGIEERDQRIAELEVDLKAHASEVYKVPKCNRGGVLNHDKEDNLMFTNCFRNRGIPVSVDKYCRIQAHGLPCAFFAELTVGVGSKA